jgi:hypothetical protein
VRETFFDDGEERGFVGLMAGTQLLMLMRGHDGEVASLHKVGVPSRPQIANLVDKRNLAA